ncbi:MAG: GNAT family N-acetyltransferase [Planctomycetota bacterium]
MDDQWVLMAVQANRAVGFMSLAACGYVDFAYIRPSAQGSGLFRRLVSEINLEATRRRETRLWVHASLTAQPAFSAVGFSIVRRESVSIGGQQLERFEMELDLTTDRAKTPD